MNDIDEKIRQALTTEDRAIMQTMADEQTVFNLIGKSFQGKMRTFMMITWVAMFAMFGFAVFSLIKFLGAAEVISKINWGVAFIVSMNFLGGMKMWYFLELNKLALARDIRRLELRIIDNAN